jgi:hypothetical protein
MKRILKVRAPIEHTICFDGDWTAQSEITGTIVCNTNDFTNLTGMRVFLVRSGSIHLAELPASRLTFLKYLTSQDNTNLGAGEKLVEGVVTSTRSLEGDKLEQYDFTISIPTSLPPTSQHITYQLLIEAALPRDEVVQTTQNIRIARRTNAPLQLRSSPSVSFPESSLKAKVIFEHREESPNNTHIPATIELSGIEFPPNLAGRRSDTKWLMPREIKWAIEETTVIFSGQPDETGNLPIASATRKESAARISCGSAKLRFKCPFSTPKGHEQEKSGGVLRIPIMLSVPDNSELRANPKLSITGDHLSDTILVTSPPCGVEEERFALLMEYKLRLWIRVGENIYDRVTGSLVDRKPNETAYVVNCDLMSIDDHSMVPPPYEDIRELSSHSSSDT